MANQKVFIFGLDRAGKTIITQYLTKGIIEQEFKPTLSFTQHLMLLPKVKCTIWDTPGQIKFRKMWLKNVQNANVLIYILDTSDSNRFDEAKKELTDFIKGLLNLKAPLILCYHKIDKAESKDNLEKAKALFAVKDNHIKDIYELETSIKDPDSLEALRNKINDLVIHEQIKDFHVKKERDEHAKELK
jgi:small GTP-binding protein